MASSTPNFNVTRPTPGVLHVEINRPQKLNAFTFAMFGEIHEIFTKVKGDGDVRCVVLSGAGEKGFTAGLDLVDNMATLGMGSDEKADSYRKTRLLREKIKYLQETMNVVEKCGKPVISVLHGISYGLALDLSCCTDIRISTTTTRFSLKEVDIGIAADLGTLTRLPKLISSLSFIKEVAYTTREFSSEEALRVGFVSYVEESKGKAMERAMEIAGRIVVKSPVAVEGTKELIEWGLGRPTEDGLRYTQMWNAPALLTGDVKEAVQAVLQKRKPRFEKL
ncbi:ClpP/crotonase-like domain-containing protein [Peziza echinospora]|nr:ClpP/crotonase-like domain-containing protein [Peziza echinospora]